MSIPTWVSGILRPAADIIDNLHTSDEERGALKNALFSAQAEFQAKVLDYEAKVAEMQAKTLTAEMSSGNWLQRSWRPLTMIWFSVLLGLVFFGQAPTYLVENPQLIDSLFDLLTIGIGGYIGSRGVEKIAPHMAQMATAMKSEKK